MKNGLLTGFCMLALGAAAAQAPKLDDYDWYDGTQLTIEGTAFTDGETPYCRLPKSAQGRVPNPVWSMSHHATGVNVRFVPQGRRLMFKWVVDNPSAVDAFMGPTAMTGLDVYRQEADGTWKFAANPRYFYYQKDAQGNEHSGEYAMNWEPGRPCMVYLPLRSTVRSFKVGIEKGAKIEALPRHPVARRIVHYGTSIVHGGCVSRPGMAFAVQEGRLADVEVINHGYSGAGKMEMEMCEMIASIDAALYVLDCDWNMSVEMQKQNYEPFVRELRKRRPTTPILLCGGCTQFDKPREQEVFARGVYAKLKAEDPVLWKNLFFVGGVEMLPKEGEATFDFCHPNDWGSMQMGRVYAEAIKKALTAGSPVPRTAAFALAKPGAVKPAGWLRDWAETMAKGYTARMDEVDAEFVRAWKPDFQPRGKKLHWSQGTWSCEGGAYWFDGLVKLGFQLDDEALKQQAKRRLDPILDNMTDHPIGFCWWLDRRDPAHFQEVYDSSDWMVNWVAGILTRPLVAWYQATGDARAKRALESALGDAYWNTCFKNESVDCVAGSVISIPSGARLAAQATGSPKIAAALRTYAEDYAKNPARETYGPAPTNGLEKTLALKRAEMFAQKIPLRHGVVANETLHSLFAAAVVTGDEGLWNSWRKWMDFLDTRARMPVGAWVMDEEWGHPGPRRGVETCALAAEVWGRLDFLATLGLGRFGDDIERAFFNAAPACVTRDCRAHVYFQQPNRLKGGDCERLSVRQDGAQQTVFREKHFPLCCTAGLNRLVPDFIQGLWMTTSDGGVAATLYAPCTFETSLAGGTFAVSEETDYPFGETITLTVKSAPSAAFPLALRLPGWCRDAALAVNGEKVALNPSAGFAKVRRAWRAGDTVTLRLPMKPRAEVVRDLDETQQDYTCVSVGPLLFARGFAEKTANDPAEPAVVPTVDPKTVVEKAEIVRLPLARPFDWPLAAPVRLRTQDAAGQPLELVPYGCTKLRAAMFPQP